VLAGRDLRRCRFHANLRSSNSNNNALSLRLSLFSLSEFHSHALARTHTHQQDGNDSFFFATFVVYGRNGYKKTTKIRPKDGDKVMSMQLVNVLVIKKNAKITSNKALQR